MMRNIVLFNIRSAGLLVSPTHSPYVDEVVTDLYKTACFASNGHVHARDHQRMCVVFAD